MSSMEKDILKPPVLICEHIDISDSFASTPFLTPNCVEAIRATNLFN